MIKLVLHKLLGTPWHVERNLNHHEGTNKISFEHEGHKIVKRHEWLIDQRILGYLMKTPFMD